MGDSTAWPDLSDLPDFSKALDGVELEDAAEEYGIDPESITEVHSLNEKLEILLGKNDVIDPEYLKGEVSDPGSSSQGHLYFDLIGNWATTHCFAFQSDAEEISDDVVDGNEVIVSGSLDFYTDNGKVEIVVKDVYPLGAGAFSRWLNELEARLEDSGVFSDEYKQPIPQFPQSIGVVTSAQGDAIHDIVDSLRSERIEADIYLYDATIQGRNAVDEIRDGIRRLDQRNLDCLVVTRGGGSDFHFRPYNDPTLIREIFDTDTPIVTALGHESDRTLADRVADSSVITPTDTNSVFTSHAKIIEWISEGRDRISGALNTIASHRLQTVSSELEQAYSRRLNTLEEWQREVETQRTHLEKAYNWQVTGTTEAYRRELDGAFNERVDQLATWKRNINNRREDLNTEYNRRVSTTIGQYRRGLNDSFASRVKQLSQWDRSIGTSRDRLNRSYTHTIRSQITSYRSNLEQAYKYRKDMHEQLQREQELQHRQRVQMVVIAGLIILLLIIGILYITGFPI